jgi:hypothetical protein
MPAGSGRWNSAITGTPGPTGPVGPTGPIGPTGPESVESYNIFSVGDNPEYDFAGETVIIVEAGRTVDNFTPGAYPHIYHASCWGTGPAVATINCSPTGPQSAIQVLGDDVNPGDAKAGFTLSPGGFGVFFAYNIDTFVFMYGSGIDWIEFPSE